MFPISTTRATLAALTFLVATMPAHLGSGTSSSFTAGLMHPLSGLDHMIAMVAVGLWAALKGGRAVWVWPLAFVVMMLVGGGLGMLHLWVPLIEPGVLVSIVAFGLLVALADDLPISAGIAIIAFFALFHGHAHGAEAPDNARGLEYMAGFAVATAFLHGVGIATALGFGLRCREPIRTAGAIAPRTGIGLVLVCCKKPSRPPEWSARPSRLSITGSADSAAPKEKALT